MTVGGNAFGPDEHRAVEGIAVLIDLMPRHPAETDDDLARRMADWGVHQGPEVRWTAMACCALAMIRGLAGGIHYPELVQVGMDALHDYNASLHERGR